MKISEITEKDVAGFLKLDDGQYNQSEVQAAMAAAEEYIADYTGLTKEEIDTKEKFWIAYMTLCQDMLDNRSYYVGKNGTNKVVDSILGMHCVNLL